MRKSIATVINYINLLSLLALTSATLFTNYPVLRICYYSFFVSFLLEIFLDKKWQNLKIDKIKIYFIILLIFFLLAPLSRIFDDTPKYFTYLMNRRYSLLGFSIIGFFGLNDKYRIKYFFMVAITTAVLSIIYLIFYRIGIHEFISNPLRHELFSTNRVTYVNDHMMFNLYMNISLIGIWYIFSSSNFRLSGWKYILYGFALIALLGVLFISEGRCGFIECCILVPSFIIIEIWKRNKKLAIGLMLLAPLFLFGAISHHKRMSQHMLVIEPRIFLWKSAIVEIKESPIYGHGISNAQEEFDSIRTKYQTEEFRIWSSQSKYIDGHNQYLHTTMEFGVIGLILLLIIYFAPIFIVDREKRILALLFIGLCAYQSVFDMFITAQKPDIFFIFVLLLFFDNTKEKSKLTT